MGELHVRGPCVARSYFRNPAEADKFTMDGWFRTGDVVTIDPEGYLRITDRSKDLIKSGGEWISSVDVENALMGPPGGQGKRRWWQCRTRGGRSVQWPASSSRKGPRRAMKSSGPGSSRAFAKFWLPDAFVFLQQIPRTATGKFLKAGAARALRDLRLPQAEKAPC